MATIVVERELELGTDAALLQAAEDAVGWCLEQHRVRFVRTYVSLDGSKMVCFYDAPDAEAVRATQRRAGLPVTSTWSASAIGAEQRVCARPGFSTVLVQRSFDVPMTAQYIAEVMRAGAPCFASHRAELLVSHLAHDSMRMVCVFEAPDAEAVRMANRQTGVPFTRAWTATMHLAPR